jgi:predicted nuclease with TOPRIM domain
MLSWSSAHAVVRRLAGLTVHCVSQVRELLEEKDEGLTAFKEMEAAALRLQEDIIKRCAERDNLLERMSELEATVAEMNTRNEELEKML